MSEVHCALHLRLKPFKAHFYYLGLRPGRYKILAAQYMEVLLQLGEGVTSFA